MATRDITLSVRPRGKPVKSLPDETTIGLDDSSEELYKRLAAQTGLSANRLRVTKGSDGSLVARSRNTTVESTWLRDRSTIYVKDLGPQIAWRTVFIIEYLGPILIHQLFYLFRRYLYQTRSWDDDKAKVPPSTRQTLTMILISLHFLKRELESIFVHRFSNATMPLSNIVKNCFHYWVLGGVNIAYWVYFPLVPDESSWSSSMTTRTKYGVIYPAIALYLFAQLANLYTHLTLRHLRASGSSQRGIPTGLGFNWVTCPNYLFEILAWIAIAIVARSLSVLLFILVSSTQMALWARKKEGRYRREFGARYHRKKYVMIPGIY